MPPTNMEKYKFIIFFNDGYRVPVIGTKMVSNPEHNRVKVFDGEDQVGLYVNVKFAQRFPLDSPDTTNPQTPATPPAQ